MYVHNIDPFLLEFGSSGMGIRWYGLAYLTTFVMGYLFCKYLAKHGRLAMTAEQVGDFITWVAIGTMAGGRLGYCLFYSPETFLEFTSDFPFWGVLAVHKGGMASHGGLAGVTFVCWYFGRKHGIYWRQLVDISGMIGALGIGNGRIANFINGELFGREAPAGFEWAVKFPSEIQYWAGYQLTKLNELTPVVKVMEGIPALQQKMATVTAESWDKLVFGYNYKAEARALVNQTLETMIWATQNGYSQVASAMEPILTARYPSQLFQAGMEGYMVFIICAIVWAVPRSPGVVTGVFGIVYSIARIIGEQYRMPDAHIGFQALGMTRGQWLSVGMLIFSIGFIWLALKQADEKVGGWYIPKSKDS
ncbi:MAG: prolipoprotein diacylglyceryl transferase [Bdellovibrionaceae bacterium]|nr:prolipoprotein diacylglyceryl transferase [Pseudobdellovibrionaceae bacterium]|tara:strand:- start:80621 stop:81709 length:1089 start_codon:yes stop_codon:yes gene_type:complete